MKCPNCGKESIVLKKQKSGYNTVVRLRLCKHCGFRFRTTEAPSKKDEALTEVRKIHADCKAMFARIMGDDLK